MTGTTLATFAGASPGITGLGRHTSWQSCIDHCPKDSDANYVAALSADDAGITGRHVAEGGKRSGWSGPLSVVPEPGVDLAPWQEHRAVIPPALKSDGQRVRATGACPPKFIHDPQHAVRAQAFLSCYPAQQPVSGEQDATIMASCRHQTEAVVR